MPYRVCKAFEVESGHMLFKHPGHCRFPHGHTRRVEIIVVADRLDENDMVCDFKALKLAVRDCVMKFDHALALNSADPAGAKLSDHSERLILFKEQDPTTEVLAKHIFDEVTARVREGREFTEDGLTYRLPSGIQVERVRVGETSTSWAEYFR